MSTNLRWILINGAGAQSWVRRALGIAFTEAGRVEHTNTRISVATYGELPVLAWSTNLQSSRGVTIAQREGLGVPLQVFSRGRVVTDRTLAVVQFPHPGREWGPDPGGRMGMRME